MIKRRLCEWLPKDSDETVEYSKRHRRYLAEKARRIQAVFSGSTVIAEQKALDLWGQIVRRIDARLSGQIALSETGFLYEYLEPYAVQVAVPLPAPEGYIVLVEDFPTLGFHVVAENLPPLSQIRLPQDIHLVPFPRPTWILNVSHENPWLPAIQFDLRSPHSSGERAS